MLLFRQTPIILSLIFGLGACTKYKSTYTAQKRGVSAGEAAKSREPGAPAPYTGPQTTLEVQLLSPKLLGEGYQARTRFSGVVSEKLPITASPGGGSFTTNNFPRGPNDVLVVEIFKGEAIQFVAKKARVQFTAVSAAPEKLQFTDCMIMTAPWDGLKSEGSCEWSIEEVP